MSEIKLQSYNKVFLKVKYSSHQTQASLCVNIPSFSVQVCNSTLLQAVPEGQSQDDVVGRPMMHLSALKQATGEAIYCDDVPLYENELYLSLVTSSKAHAYIL